MNKFKIFLCFLFIISLTGITSAETINYDYTTYTEKIYKDVPQVTSITSAYVMQSLVTNDVTLLEVTEAIIVNIPKNFKIEGVHKDEITLDFPIDFKIGNNIVGSGTYQRTTSKDKNGVINSVVVTIVIDNFDAKGYINKQYIEMIPKGNATTDDFVFIFGNIYRYPENLDDGLGIFLSISDTYTPSRSITYNRLAVDFHQVLEYHVTENVINLNFFRHEITNFIEVKYGEQKILSELKNTDIFTTSYFKPLKISVQNPYTLTFWNNTIPEDLEIPDNKIIKKLGMEDSVTRYPIKGYVEIEREEGGVYTTSGRKESINQVLQEIEFDKGYKYKLNFKSSNHKDFELITPTTIDNLYSPSIVQLDLDQGSNISVSFRAENMNYGEINSPYPHQFITHFSLTKDGITHQSGDNGYVIFNNISPQEFSVIANANGFDEYQKDFGLIEHSGSYTLKMTSGGFSKNLLMRFYNGDNPSQTINTHYKISIQENGVWNIVYEGDAEQGYFTRFLKIGFNHKIEYSATGYKSGVVNYNPFHSETVEYVYLFPDGSNNTLIFEVKDSEGIPSYGAKVTIGNEEKFTDINGKTSFSLQTGMIEYEVYKQGYQKIGNTYNLIEDKTLKIVLLKDGESVIPTSTPTTPNEFDKPSNILESVKLAFSKMFGFDYTNTEDITKNNLLFALILILGCSALIAGITKDGIGALVGGVIGFVFASALSLIPIWVLISGFAMVAVYVIMFKITNDGD